MRHSSQRTDYAAGKTRSPFEAAVSGRFVVEKLLPRPFASAPQWVAMANGDADDADGLKRLERTAETLGGDVRIVRRRDGRVMFQRKSSQELSAVDAHESEQ